MIVQMRHLLDQNAYAVIRIPTSHNDNANVTIKAVGNIYYNKSLLQRKGHLTDRTCKRGKPC